MSLKVLVNKLAAPRVHVMHAVALGAVFGVIAPTPGRAEEGSAGGAFQTSYGSFVPGAAPELATQTRFVAPPPSPAAAPAPRAAPGARVVRVILPSPYMNDR